MPSPDQKLDHAEEARRLLHETTYSSPPLMGERAQDAAVGMANVHASLAIAEELRGIREAIGDYLGDGSNADQIAQALRAIAEPEKFGIDPRSLR